MKTTEILMCGVCLAVAFIVTFGDASRRAWRPQGRFGKRTELSPLPRAVDTTSADDAMMQNALEAEILSQNEQLLRLCADSKFAAFPGCVRLKGSLSSSGASLSSARRLRTFNNLADILNL